MFHFFYIKFYILVSISHKQKKNQQRKAWNQGPENWRNDALFVESVVRVCFCHNRFAGSL